jgi:hypothetical protein
MTSGAGGHVMEKRWPIKADGGLKGGSPTLGHCEKNGAKRNKNSATQQENPPQ